VSVEAVRVADHEDRLSERIRCLLRTTSAYRLLLNTIKIEIKPKFSSNTVPPPIRKSVTYRKQICLSSTRSLLCHHYQGEIQFSPKQIWKFTFPGIRTFPISPQTELEIQLFMRSGHAQFPPKQIWEFTFSGIPTCPICPETDSEIHF